MKQELQRLNELALEALKYYDSDPRNEFKGIPRFNSHYTRLQRISFIEALVNVIKTLPLDRVENEGFGSVILDIDNMSIEQRNILKYITIELNSKVLRGTESGYKLKPKDLPYVNKWNPLVMSVLCETHTDLIFKDFIVRNNTGKHFLGKDLKDLLVQIEYEDALKVHKASKYFVSRIGRIIKDEKTEPQTEYEREQVTDNDEDRINYNAKGNQIIRNWSPWSLAFQDEYTKEYESIRSNLKLSKDYMSKLVHQGILNKPKYDDIPEGYDF